MFKKAAYIAIILPVLLALAACSSLNLPGTTSASANSGSNQGQNGQNGRGFFSDPSKMPVEQKLAIGTLKLEGTNQAITADEAKNLLPLWKALKSLATSNNASQDEVTALEQQIKDTMTPDQVSAIQKLTWTQDDLRAMMQQYGVQAGQGGNFGNLTPEQRATRIAQFQQNGGGAGRTGGNGGGGGFPGGGAGGGNFGGGQGGQTGQAQRTPVPGQGSARRAMGMNNIFVDPVIKLLEQKTGTTGS